MKTDPFIRRCLGAKYSKVPFQNLKVSTATIDVRLSPETDLQYVSLFRRLQIETNKTSTDKLPSGSIFAGICGDEKRGHPPTKSEKSQKNCMTIWMWLEDKYVNLKVSRNNIHVTGCKTPSHAAEATRNLQMHIELIHNEENPVYANYPYAVDFSVHMINYNFKTDVALNLQLFDIFIGQKYSKVAFSPYDANVAATNMSLKCPSFSSTFTINDNGQISMCAKGSTFEEVDRNIVESYALLYTMLEEYQKTI